METQTTGGLGSRVAKPAHVPQSRVFDWDMYNPPGIEEGLYESWMNFTCRGF